MDLPMVLDWLSQLLSVKDLVTLGCCSTHYEREAHRFLPVRMREKVIDKEKREFFGKNNRIEIIFDPTSYDGFAASEAMLSKTQGQIVHFKLLQMQHDVYVAALSKSIGDLDKCSHELGRHASKEAYF